MKNFKKIKINTSNERRNRKFYRFYANFRTHFFPNFQFSKFLGVKALTDSPICGVYVGRNYGPVEKIFNFMDKLFSDNKIKKVALCGGAGSSLLSAARLAGAHVFVTGDFKYHEFFDAENEILIADIGHYESEQYTKELLVAHLSKKITNFAVVLSKVKTNPVSYF